MECGHGWKREVGGGAMSPQPSVPRAGEDLGIPNAICTPNMASKAQMARALPHTRLTAKSAISSTGIALPSATHARYIASTAALWYA